MGRRPMLAQRSNSAGVFGVGPRVRGCGLERVWRACACSASRLFRRRHVPLVLSASATVAERVNDLAVAGSAVRRSISSARSMPVVPRTVQRPSVRSVLHSGIVRRMCSEKTGSEKRLSARRLQ
jgi:hypothetical protein